MLLFTPVPVYDFCVTSSKQHSIFVSEKLDKRIETVRRHVDRLVAARVGKYKSTRAIFKTREHPSDTEDTEMRFTAGRKHKNTE